MMDQKELDNRFMYHKPSNDFIADAHGTVREICSGVSGALNEILPDSREKSLAMTHLEETMMWANAAIARHQSAE